MRRYRVTRQHEATRFLWHVLAAAAAYRGESQVNQGGLADFIRQQPAGVAWTNRIQKYREALDRVATWRRGWVGERPGDWTPAQL